MPVQHRRVAADLHLVDSPRRWSVEPQVSISTGSCGAAKRSSAALAQRIEHDDRRAAPGRLAQRGQHARMVGAGVVAEAEDRVGMVEILERHRALADADRLRQADAGRPRGTCSSSRGSCWCRRRRHEQLIEERRLVGGAARGVELRLVGMVERAAARRRSARRPRPSDRHEAVGGRRRRPSDAVSRPASSSAWSLQPQSSATVCAAKNSGVARLVVASQVTALAPFSQNSNEEVCLGSGQAQPGQSKPSGWFMRNKRACRRSRPSARGPSAPPPRARPIPRPARRRVRCRRSARRSSRQSPSCGIASRLRTSPARAPESNPEPPIGRAPTAPRIDSGRVSRDAKLSSEAGRAGVRMNDAGDETARGAQHKAQGWPEGRLAIVTRVVGKSTEISQRRHINGAVRRRDRDRLLFGRAGVRHRQADAARDAAADGRVAPARARIRQGGATPSRTAPRACRSARRVRRRRDVPARAEGLRDPRGVRPSGLAASRRSGRGSASRSSSISAASTPRSGCPRRCGCCPTRHAIAAARRLLLGVAVAARQPRGQGRPPSATAT